MDLVDTLTAKWLSEKERADKAEARVAELETERVRRFPIQPDRHGPPGERRSHAPIPWAVAERAYASYSARYGRGQSLERLAQRGGFSCGEMDMYAPGWEAECTEVHRLEARVAKLEAELSDERAAWDAQRKSADAQRSRLVEEKAKLESRVAELEAYVAELEQISKDVVTDSNGHARLFGPRDQLESRVRVAEARVAELEAERDMWRTRAESQLTRLQMSHACEIEAAAKPRPMSEAGE